MMSFFLPNRWCKGRSNPGNLHCLWSGAPPKFIAKRWQWLPGRPSLVLPGSLWLYLARVGIISGQEGWAKYQTEGLWSGWHSVALLWSPLTGLPTPEFTLRAPGRHEGEGRTRSRRVRLEWYKSFEKSRSSQFWLRLQLQLASTL